jgi:hypothetical protein
LLGSKHKQNWRDSHLKDVEEISNKTREYFYSPEKPVPTKEKRPKSQEMESPKNKDFDSFYKTSTLNLNQTVIEKQSGLFLTENSFITAYGMVPKDRTPSPRPPPKKEKPPVPRLNNLFGEKPDGRVKTVNVPNMGQATKNFRKQIRSHVNQQNRMQHEIKQLFRTNVFEKIEHKSRNHRKNLSMTQPEAQRNRSSKDPKYISSRPVERKIKIEDQHFSQVEAKERILSGVIKSGENLEKLFDFAEMLKLNKNKPSTATSSLQPRKAPTYSISAEPTIVERILQSNEFFREAKRPTTSQTPPDPFVNIHMRNFREKSMFPKSKPKFLTPKSPQRVMRFASRDPNFRSAKIDGSPLRRDSSGAGNLDIRALRTSGYSPF